MSLRRTHTPPNADLQDDVGAALARAALVVVLLIVALGLLRGQRFVEMLIFGITLAVIIVPVLVFAKWMERKGWLGTVE